MVEVTGQGQLVELITKNDVEKTYTKEYDSKFSQRNSLHQCNHLCKIFWEA